MKLRPARWDEIKKEVLAECHRLLDARASFTHILGGLVLARDSGDLGTIHFSLRIADETLVDVTDNSPAGPKWCIMHSALGLENGTERPGFWVVAYNKHHGGWAKIETHCVDDEERAKKWFHDNGWTKTSRHDCISIEGLEIGLGQRIDTIGWPLQ